MKPNRAYHCFYTLVASVTEYVLLLFYVDDVIIASKSEALTMKYVSTIGKRFRISFSGKLTSYLNIGITHDRELKTVSMSQERYIEELIEEYQIPTNPSIRTPMQENLKLSATEEENTTPRQLQYVANFPYRKLIGAVIYLNVCNRPTISYDISILDQVNAKPTFLACKALLWLCKFLFKTKSDNLTLGGGVSTLVVTSFCDSDWGGCVNIRHSRSGHVVFIGNDPVVWYSKRQTNVAQSSAEAEFIAKSSCCETCYQFANIPGIRFRLASCMWSDNQSSIAIALNPVLHNRTKHIPININISMNVFKMDL